MSIWNITLWELLHGWLQKAFSISLLICKATGRAALAHTLCFPSTTLPNSTQSRSKSNVSLCLTPHKEPLMLEVLWRWLVQQPRPRASAIYFPTSLPLGCLWMTPCLAHKLMCTPVRAAQVSHVLYGEPGCLHSTLDVMMASKSFTGYNP